MNDLGQISIDFITAIAIFMLMFTFLVLQIPGIFVPFQTTVTDLQPVAYRTSVILVEDCGWWNNTHTQWETEISDPSKISRIGLAKNKPGSDRGIPNLLSKDKIEGLKSLYQNTNYSSIQEKLGLKTSIRSYDYNISLRNSTGSLLTNSTNDAILCIGLAPPSAGTVNVEKIERFVLLYGYNETTAKNTFNVSGYRFAKLVVEVW
ncbi:MAG: DUF7287 family protein [Candidatus Syntropharchaeia archaeon]